VLYRFEFGVVELFWTPGRSRASMQKRDLGRLNVVAVVNAPELLWWRIGDCGDDEFRRSKPELDEIDAGEPGDEIGAAVVTSRWCPVGVILLGGEQGGEVEFGRIVLQCNHYVLIEKIILSFLFTNEDVNVLV